MQGLTYKYITEDIIAVPGYGYIVNGNDLIKITLPKDEDSEIGDQIIVLAPKDSLWKLCQNEEDTIEFCIPENIEENIICSREPRWGETRSVKTTTTPGTHGFIQATSSGDNIHLIKMGNHKWMIHSMIGNFYYK